MKPYMQRRYIHKPKQKSYTGLLVCILAVTLAILGLMANKEYTSYMVKKQIEKRATFMNNFNSELDKIKQDFENYKITEEEAKRLIEQCEIKHVKLAKESGL